MKRFQGFSCCAVASLVLIAPAQAKPRQVQFQPLTPGAANASSNWVTHLNRMSEAERQERVRTYGMPPAPPNRWLRTTPTVATRTSRPVPAVVRPSLPPRPDGYPATLYQNQNAKKKTGPDRMPSSSTASDRTSNADSPTRRTTARVPAARSTAQATQTTPRPTAPRITSKAQTRPSETTSRRVSTNASRVRTTSTDTPGSFNREADHDRRCTKGAEEILTHSQAHASSSSQVYPPRSPSNDRPPSSREVHPIMFSKKTEPKPKPIVAKPQARTKAIPKAKAKPKVETNPREKSLRHQLAFMPQLTLRPAPPIRGRPTNREANTNARWPILNGNPAAPWPGNQSPSPRPGPRPSPDPNVASASAHFSNVDRPPPHPVSTRSSKWAPKSVKIPNSRYVTSGMPQPDRGTAPMIETTLFGR